MPFVWIKRGEEAARETLYNKSNGLCCLRHLGFDTFSIELDGKLGFMEEGCVFSVSRFREETEEARGSTADLAINVTGKTGGACFAEGSSVNVSSNCFVVMDSDRRLAQILGGGRWSMVVGHRQSGKTTTGIVAAKLLQQQQQTMTGPKVDVYHITLTSPMPTAASLWEQMHKQLHSLNPGRFPMPQEGFDQYSFALLFSPSTSSDRIGLIVDEAGLLYGMEGIDTFLTVMRTLRDQRSNGFTLHSLVLMGTEKLNLAVSPSRTDPLKPLNYSPFSLDDIFEPDAFSEGQICDLLDQFCLLKGVSLLPDTAAFSDDIYTCTGGHRGLTGVCCSELEMLMGFGRSLTLEDWKLHAWSNLVTSAMSKSTYKRILEDLSSLKGGESELFELVLLRGGCHVSRSHPAVISLLNMGIVRVVNVISAGGELLKHLDEQYFGLDLMPVDSFIVIAAPLLSAMLLSSSSVLLEAECLEVPPKDNKQGLGLWILTSALQNADERVLQAKEVQLRGRSKKVQASEYTWQALFGLLGRAVLQTQPQLSSCKMLAEVTNSKDHLRLDWLLRNGLGPYGYEFVVRADQNDWDAHWRRSIIYANAHGAHVFCCNIYVPNATGHELKRPTLPSPSDKVTPVNVLYSRATDELKVWMDNSAQPTKVLKLHRPRLHHLRLPKSVRPVISSRFGTLKSVKPF